MFKACLRAIAIFVAAISVSSAGTVTLTGHLLAPDGTPLNGTLSFTLSKNSALILSTACSLSSAQIASNTVTRIQVVTGQLVSPPQLYGNDCLQPNDTYYAVTMKDNNGNLLFSDYWILQGSAVDIGTIVSSTLSGTLADLISQNSNLFSQIESDVKNAVTSSLTNSISTLVTNNISGSLPALVQSDVQANLSTVVPSLIVAHMADLVIPEIPSLETKDYAWSSMTQTLSYPVISANTSTTISFPACPSGVQAGYYILIVDSTGSQTEPVKVAGGTCTPSTWGTPGTLIFTSAKNHNANLWHLETATSGIQEALNAGNAGHVVNGNNIIQSNIHVTPNASLNPVYATIFVHSYQYLYGSAHTWIVPANGAWCDCPQWKGAPQVLNSVITTDANASYVHVSDLILEGNGGNQGGTKPLAFVVNTQNGSHTLFENLTVQGWYAFGAGMGDLGWTGTDNTFRKNVITGNGGAPITCIGGIFAQSPQTKYVENWLDNLCDDGLILNGTSSMHSVIANNTVLRGTGNLAINMEDSYDSAIVGNTVYGDSIGNGFASGIQVIGTDRAGPQISIVITGNHIYGTRYTGIGVYGNPGNLFSQNITITGNTISNINGDPAGSQGILLAGAVVDTVVSSNAIYNVHGSGINITSQTSSMPTNITVIGNTISWNHGDAILLGNGGGFPPANLISITGNVMRGNSGKGINAFPVNQAATNWVISNNSMYGNNGGDMGFSSPPDSLSHATISGNVTDGAWNALDWSTGTTASQLPTSIPNGAMIYCKDCGNAVTCTGGGGGAMAFRLVNQWICNY